MDEKISTRQIVADMLTELFGDKNSGIIFQANNLIKRSVGGKKYTKYELKTSANWYANYRGLNSNLISVTSIGMTMTEFIREFKNHNIHYVISKKYGFSDITVFRNQPEWKTYGCVKDMNLQKDEITLYLAGLLLVDEVIAEITEKTPKWLIESSLNFPAFTCKIYQAWRSMESFQGFDWSKVWKTFKFDGLLSKEDMNNFI